MFRSLLLAAAAVVQPVGGHSLQLCGIKFVGVNPENGRKLLFTLAAIGVFFAVRLILSGISRMVELTLWERLIAPKAAGPFP